MHPSTTHFTKYFISSSVNSSLRHFFLIIDMIFIVRQWIQKHRKYCCTAQPRDVALNYRGKFDSPAVVRSLRTACDFNRQCVTFTQNKIKDYSFSSPCLYITTSTTTTTITAATIAAADCSKLRASVRFVGHNVKCNIGGLRVIERA